MKRDPVKEFFDRVEQDRRDEERYGFLLVKRTWDNIRLEWVEERVDPALLAGPSEGDARCP